MWIRYLVKSDTMVWRGPYLIEGIVVCVCAWLDVEMVIDESSTCVMSFLPCLFLFFFAIPYVHALIFLMIFL